jgi:hypothetical protein
MLSILTPLSKLERVSRKIDPSNFVATPGLWAYVDVDGSLKNIVTDTPGTITKMIISSASTNMYESHDIEVGRISTLESIGARVKVDTEGFDGTVNQGAFLVVSDKAGSEGKLIDVTVKPNGEAGVYEIVARAEEVNAVEGWIIFRTVSPESVTLV